MCEQIQIELTDMHFIQCATAGIQQQCRPLWVHCDAANEATKQICQDVHFAILHEFGSSKDKNPHVIECKLIHIAVAGHQ